MTKCNILYLHSHDSGRYIQPYGYPVPTPNLQRLAGEGVLFSNAFCAAPTCSPSRAAMLTGQSAHASGMIGLAHRGFSLTDPGQHLANLLRTAGYRTVLAGVQHETSGDPHSLGYQDILALQKPWQCNVGAAAAGWLRQAPRTPWFLSAGFFDTHREYPHVEPGAGKYVRPPAPVPATPATRNDMAAYIASAARLDAGIGEVLEALQASGQAGNTLVLCTTDHGLAFPGMKCTLTDHGIGVFLILRGPQDLSGGRVCDALTSQVDIMPTICELIGIPTPGWAEGHSLWPVLRGEAAEVREAVYAEVTYHAAYEPQRCARTRRWKYIRRYGSRLKPVLPNCDDSPSKDAWLAHGWAEQTVAQEQLYDLVFDPNEAHNLACDPLHAPALEEMRVLLADWMGRTHDPLLVGEPVPAPGDAVVNNPDGLSPNEPVRKASELWL
ncbi:MAG: sulfatase family protein [Anaerolineae bacterium]